MNFSERPRLTVVKVGQYHVPLTSYPRISMLGRFLREYGPAAAVILSLVIFSIAGGGLLVWCAR